MKPNFKTTHIAPVLLFATTWAILNSCNVQNTPQRRTAGLEKPPPARYTCDTVDEVAGEIRGIFQDSKNNLWFASNGEGAFKYDGNMLLQFSEKHGLCSNGVWDIQEGRDGNMWFKTADGVCSFDGRAFTTVQPDTSASALAACDVLRDELLFDYCYHGNSLVKIQLPHTSPIKNDKNARFHYDIYSSCKDRNGNLWFGTCTAGVCKYDGKTYTWLKDKELGAPVRSIFEDKNGVIWIGNNGYGLFRYDGKQLTNVTKAMKLENPEFIKTFESKAGTLARVWTITDDRQGNLWIGTIDAGAWKYEGENLTNFTTRNGLGSDGIWIIYRDRKEDLWFGTDGAGAYKLLGKTFAKL